jgi:hypothetical protein
MDRVFHEYPKSLYGKGWDNLSDEVIVNSAAEEKASRAKGYKSLAEPASEKADKPASKKDGW